MIFCAAIVNGSHGMRFWHKTSIVAVNTTLFLAQALLEYVHRCGSGAPVGLLAAGACLTGWFCAHGVELAMRSVEQDISMTRESPTRKSEATCAATFKGSASPPTSRRACQARSGPHLRVLPPLLSHRRRKKWHRRTILSRQLARRPPRSHPLPRRLPAALMKLYR
jgi:hypothetical protein